MKAPTKAALATLGGATALALTVGFGGIDVNSLTAAPTPVAHTSSSVTPAAPRAGTSAVGDGVHAATLAGCVSGLDC